MENDRKTDLHTIPTDPPAAEPQQQSGKDAQGKPAKRQTAEMQAEDRSDKPLNSDG